MTDDRRLTWSFWGVMTVGGGYNLRGGVH